MLSVVCLAVATSGWAQFGSSRMGGPKLTDMPNLMNPVTGTGAAYQMTTKKSMMNVAYVVVGKEQVDGDDGYWLEIRMDGAETHGEMVMKDLVVPNPAHFHIARMIAQPPGRPPMEMPAGMMSMMQRDKQNQKPDDNFLGEKVETETLTVPAGSFECDHYRKTDDNGKTVDLWISNKISPYGMVKMTNGEFTLLLQKTLTNETSHIKGEPQKMDMPHF